MAKGNKHSPALFEVVHGKKHFDKTARESSLRTPGWWFKGRRRMEEVGALPPAGGSTGAGDGAATALEEPPEDVDGEIPPSAADPTENPSFLARREQERQPARQAEPASAPVEAMEIPAALTDPSRPRRRSPFQYVLDRDRHELFVRVRITTAVVTGVSVLVVIALAYITGRNVGRGPAPALASASAEEIAAGPVDKGVLDLPRRGARTSQASPPAASGGASYASPGSRVPNPNAQPASAPAQARAPAAPTQPAAPLPTGPAARLPRTINFQYVIVQSYPAKEKQMADDAADALNRAGIPCTVEKGVAGYTSADWYCVVGTTGFERASGPAYDKYLADIEKVNERYAGKSRFKRFTPGAVRWRGPASGA